MCGVLHMMDMFSLTFSFELERLLVVLRFHCSCSDRSRAWTITSDCNSTFTTGINDSETSDKAVLLISHD